MPQRRGSSSGRRRPQPTHPPSGRSSGSSSHSTGNTQAPPSTKCLACLPPSVAPHGQTYASIDNRYYRQKLDDGLYDTRLLALYGSGSPKPVIDQQVVAGGYQRCISVLVPRYPAIETQRHADLREIQDAELVALYRAGVTKDDIEASKPGGYRISRENLVPRYPEIEGERERNQANILQAAIRNMSSRRSEWWTSALEGRTANGDSDELGIT